MKNNHSKAPQCGASPVSAATALAGRIGGGDTPSAPISKRFPRPTKDAILVCPLGGVGRIGMNWTLYGHDGRWLLVDAGASFAPKEVEGIDAIMPDPAVLKAILPNLVGLAVTHAHEDHIGAIHRLWPGIGCPIHATPFAAEVLRSRFKEMGTLAKVDLRTFRPGETINADPFAVHTVPITHSAPECVAMGIRTAVGTIVHTGDWKLDPDPVVGDVTDVETLRALGDEGVLAMTCDSTNAEREAMPISEGEIARTLEQTFRTRRGMIVVSCFASNVARLVAIGQAASATGRKVALAGFSLRRNEELARAVGLIGDDHPFLTETRHLKGLDRHETVLVCTGTQGEDRSALARLSRGDEDRSALARLSRGDDDRLPALRSGDTLIHSARVIPGNEEEVETVMTAIRARGVEILMGADGDLPLHASGHASRGELREMYGLVRPRFAVPVHGEPAHMAAHAKLALDCGVRDAALTTEGDVLRVSRRRVERIAHVEVPHVAALAGFGPTQLVQWNEATNSRVETKKRAGGTQRRRRRNRGGRDARKAA